MANNTIESISLDTVTESTGFLGRKMQTQERLCFKTSGGHIYLSENVLSMSGDSWRLFKARLRDSAGMHGIPFEDKRH